MNDWPVLNDQGGTNDNIEPFTIVLGHVQDRAFQAPTGEVAADSKTGDRYWTDVRSACFKKSISKAAMTAEPIKQKVPAA